MKNAVVTGGGSGIGQAIANRLRADGHHVAILDLNPSDDEFAFTADVTDRAAVDDALDADPCSTRPGDHPRQRRRAGRLQEVHRHHVRDWQQVIDVNLNGVFHCIQAVLPDMIEAGWGRIVNISSSSTHSGQPYMAPLRRGEVRRQRAHQVAGAGVRAERHHGQRGATRLHRHADAAQGRGARASSATSSRTSSGPRCGASAGPKTSPRRAPSSSPRRPATSPARSWASTAAETPSAPATRPISTTNQRRDNQWDEFQARSHSSRAQRAARAAATRSGWPKKAPTSSPSTSARTSTPSATRWRRRRISRRPPRSSRRPASASSPPRPTCATPRS